MSLLTVSLIVINVMFFTAKITAIRVRRYERYVAKHRTNALLDAIQTAIPEIKISNRLGTVYDPDLHDTNHPYDHDSEEAFEQIAQNYNKPTKE